MIVAAGARETDAQKMARDALRDGATLVTMSGDKLLGGPQAGIIVGDRTIVAALRANPLARSYRVDKLTLAALEATLALYRDPGRALREIPVLAMLGTPVGALRDRARHVRERLGSLASQLDVVDSEASVGGGAFPRARIPSVALAVAREAAAVERRLRLGSPAVIGRLADDKLLIDLRTVREEEDEALAAGIGTALDGAT